MIVVPFERDSHFPVGVWQKVVIQLLAHLFHPGENYGVFNILASQEMRAAERVVDCAIEVDPLGPPGWQSARSDEFR